MKKNYIPDLTKFSHTQEINYSRLLVILGNQNINEISNFDLDENILASFEIIDVQPFTRTLKVIQKHKQKSSLVDFEMKIRIYEDVKMAEVISYQKERHFLGNYDYPNTQMYQPDEKFQLNLFLKELLGLCLEQKCSKSLITSN